MSAADRRPEGADLPQSWERLERAAGAAARVISTWKRRAVAAEAEVVRLRGALEDLAEANAASGDDREEVRRLRAENAALRSRIGEARTRIGAVLKRLASLGLDV